MRHCPQRLQQKDYPIGPEKFLEKIVVVGENGITKTFTIGLFLTSPPCAPEKWRLSLGNGELNSSFIEFTDLGEALRVMAALNDNPALVSKAYISLTSKTSYLYKPFTIKDFYESIGIQSIDLPPLDSPRIVEEIKNNPVLGLYLLYAGTLPKSIPKDTKIEIEKIRPWTTF